MRKNFHFPNEWKKVTTFVKFCESCIKNVGIVKCQTELQEFPLPEQPFEVISADLLGPLPETADGQKYILAVVDFLTRYSILIPIKNKEAITVTEAFRKKVFSQFGVPRILLSDCGTEFKNNTMTSLCKEYRVKKVEVAPAKPNSNGLVERVNQKTIRSLKHYLNADTEDTWDLLLPEINTAINTAFNSTLGDNSHFLLFGYDHRHIASVPSPNNLQPIYNYDEFYSVITNKFQQIRKYLHTRIPSETKKFINIKNKNAKNRFLKVNDRCFLKTPVMPGENKKFSAHYDGPYQVLKILSKFKYLIRPTHASSKQTRVAHIDNMIAR